MSALPTPPPPLSTPPPAQDTLALSPMDLAESSPASFLDYALPMQEETSRYVDHDPLSSSPTIQVDLNHVFLSAVYDMLSPSSTTASSRKRPAADEVDEPIRKGGKAKAIGYATPMRPLTEEKEDTETTLERNSTCPICADIFYDPAKCLECSHTFCGSCIVQWFDESDTCPTCRRIVTSTKDSAKMTASLEYFYNAYPTRNVSEEKIADKETIYKPGQEIASIEQYSNFNDEYDVDNDESRFADMDNMIAWQQCRWCESLNEEGFTCPEPIPHENPETGPVRSDRFVFRGHVKCGKCDRSIPITWKDGWECRGCGDTWCGNFWNCESSEAKNHLTLAKDQTVLFVSSLTAPVSPIGGNRIEQIRLSEYIAANGITWDDVGRRVTDWLFEKYGSLPCHYRGYRNNKEDYHFLRTDYICRGCMHHIYKDYLMHWWHSGFEGLGSRYERMCYESNPECPYARFRG
ncbi:hypothetical protein RUND412_009740 [Rhizina undulata]